MLKKILITIDPVSAIEKAKKEGDQRTIDEAMEEIKKRLDAMEYGRKKLSTFSKKEQRKIMAYLSALDGRYLISYIEGIKKKN